MSELHGRQILELGKPVRSKSGVSVRDVMPVAVKGNAIVVPVKTSVKCNYITA